MIFLLGELSPIPLLGFVALHMGILFSFACHFYMQLNWKTTRLSISSTSIKIFAFHSLIKEADHCLVSHDLFYMFLTN